MNNDMGQTRLELYRHARAERRRERLAPAIEEAKNAILQCHQEQGKHLTVESAVDRCTAIVKGRRSVGISPILITIIIQLLPILIKWFIDHRAGFMADIDNVARDLSFASAACVTVHDFSACRGEMEEAASRHETMGGNEVQLRNLSRVIAIAAILRVLEGFLTWWTK